MTCWMLPDKPPCLILLGRYGDLIQLMPAFKAVHDRTGMKPIVMVSHNYADIFEGVSYAHPYVINMDWWRGVPIARRIAEEVFGGGVVVQWWSDDPERIALLEAATKGGLVLQSHGHEWGVDMARWPNYGASMWDRAGFTRDEMMSLPLVFDRRHAGREAELHRVAVPRSPSKPVLLYNFTGVSSPFGFVPEILNPLLTLHNRFHLVDLGRIRAFRIYDLLGLYDRAVGLITSDTATLHLAPGAPTLPYIAFTIDGWTSSVPKGNCVLTCGYNESPRRVTDMMTIVHGWLNAAQQKAA